MFQVNSTEVLGLEHDQAIEVVKETPANVMIVVARQISAEAGEEERVANDREENGRSHFTGLLIPKQNCNVKIVF